MGHSLRTPATEKGRGTSGGEGANRRRSFLPYLGRGCDRPGYAWDESRRAGWWGANWYGLGGASWVSDGQ